MPECTYSLKDLARKHDVSPRTIRYYISEGLLPPPDVAGRHSHYSELHSDRLKFIADRKSEYLPLREIRRQLDEMSDQAIAEAAVGTSLSSLESRHRMMQDRYQSMQEDATSYVDRALQDQQLVSTHPPKQSRPSVSLNQPGHCAESRPGPHPRITAQQSWTRIQLGDQAELLIRNDLYARKRDRVDWLVSWARKVFS